MTIARHIEDVRERLRRGEFSSEAAVSQGIVLPTLQELGWPVFDIKIVVPEYSVGGRRVDYALCRTAEKPAVFVEVKRVGFSVGADRQLFEYAFHLGVPLAILTDGQEWSFYLPGEQGRYDERRVYKLDLLERDTEEAVKRLERYLRYDRVCAGEALEAARTDYWNEAPLPRASRALLEEPNQELLDMLADKAEELCRWRPDEDTCRRFLKHGSQKQPAISTDHAQAQQPLTDEVKISRVFEELNDGHVAYTNSGKTYVQTDDVISHEYVLRSAIKNGFMLISPLNDNSKFVYFSNKTDSRIIIYLEFVNESCTILVTYMIVRYTRKGDALISILSVNKITDEKKQDLLRETLFRNRNSNYAWLRERGCTPAEAFDPEVISEWRKKWFAEKRNRKVAAQTGNDES